MPRTSKPRPARWVICAAAALVAGCASTAQAPAPPAGRPQWVDDPGAAFASTRGSIVYAVGHARVALDVPTMRRRAKIDARRVMRSALKPRVEAILEQWMASAAEQVKPECSASAQLRNTVAGEAAHAAAAEAKATNAWLAADGSLYCLAVLGRDRVFDAMQDALDETLRDMDAAEQARVLTRSPKDAVADFGRYLKQHNEIPPPGADDKRESP